MHDWSHCWRHGTGTVEQWKSGTVILMTVILTVHCRWSSEAGLWTSLQQQSSDGVEETGCGGCIEQAACDTYVRVWPNKTHDWWHRTVLHAWTGRRAALGQSRTVTPRLQKPPSFQRDFTHGNESFTPRTWSDKKNILVLLLLLLI